MSRFISILLVFISFPLFSIALEEDNAARLEYITNWKDEAILQMAEHKIPASITLAQGILESGDGKSRLAREANNHFGIKCHNDWNGARIYHDDDAKGECFRKYKTAHESFEDHSVFLKKKRYEPLFKLRPDDYRNWAKGLKECGYATNPKYPQLLITIIENFDLTEYDEIGMEYIRKNTVPAKGSSPSLNTQSSKNKKNSKQKDTDERMSITLRNQREILLSDNHIKFIIAKSGDSQESISRDLDMREWQIRKYNDLSKGDLLNEGQIIYLQPKRNKSKEKIHIVQPGESAWSISQKYGIKLKRLYKLNELDFNSEVKPGVSLKLRR